jgi:hypothetical protein
MHTRITRRRIKGLAATLAVALCALGFAGCEGSGGSSDSNLPGGGSLPASATLQVTVVNVLSEPIEGAAVTVDTDGAQQQATTSASGIVSFADLPTGPMTLSISADGFEAESVSGDLARGMQHWDFSLMATGAWAIGRAIVLGTETLERSDDGSGMTFSVDVAVIAGENAEALETLTDADFRIYTIDCGWGGPRDCASDAAGNVTAGGGVYSTDGLALAFELQPPSARRSYLAGVLAERSGDGSEWDVKGPALGSFFTALSGNDAVGLASVQVEDETTTFTVLGPFTSDGDMYLDAIDRLASPAGPPPLMQASLLESIRWTAAATASEFPGRDATLLVLSNPDLSIAEIDEAVTLAQQSGVHISAVTGEGYGLPEIVVRTGGFVAQMNDIRQFGMAFGAMDQTLAGTLPFYRMQFQLTGEAGIFGPGGNVKVRMQIDVPTSIVSRGVHTQFDVAIPR